MTRQCRRHSGMQPWQDTEKELHSWRSSRHKWSMNRESLLFGNRWRFLSLFCNNNNNNNNNSSSNNSNTSSSSSNKNISTGSNVYRAVVMTRSSIARIHLICLMNGEECQVADNAQTKWTTDCRSARRLLSSRSWSVLPVLLRLGGWVNPSIVDNINLPDPCFPFNSLLYGNYYALCKMALELKLDTWKSTFMSSVCEN